VALKLGHDLKKCSRLVESWATMKKPTDKESIEDAKYFEQLCNSEWSDEISSKALKTVAVRRRNKVKLLPLSEDVTKLLHKYLQSEITESMNLLETNCNIDGQQTEIEKYWRRLASATLAQIITFNRRRSGEVSRMTVNDFHQRTKSSTETDAQAALDPLERSLCKLFTHIEIDGKCGRTVPVLLKEETEKALELLDKTRGLCGIKIDNEYAFALSHSDNHIRGHDCIRLASANCGAKCPLALRSTNLHKHVATLCQMMELKEPTLCQMIELKENELDMLAQYMGHDIRVHRNYYRLPEDTLQSAMLAKLFLAMEDGTLVGQKGKTLQELLIQLPEDDLCKFFNIFCICSARSLNFMLMKDVY
jgi:hypothetical protein